MRPSISLVVAMDENGVIGKDNKLPWHLPRDLRRFRELTEGKPVIMGRKTFDSIMAMRGVPLPRRMNIVLTRKPYPICHDEVCIVHSVQDALAAAGALEAMVIGGAEVYRLFLPIADRLYMTLVKGSFDGDTHFPNWNRRGWRMVEYTDQPHDEKNPHDCQFITFERDRFYTDTDPASETHDR